MRPGISGGWLPPALSSFLTIRYLLECIGYPVTIVHEGKEAIVQVRE